MIARFQRYELSFTIMLHGPSLREHHLRGGRFFYDTLILAALFVKLSILTRLFSKIYYNDLDRHEYRQDVRMLATVYLDGKKLKRIRTLKGKTQRALSRESGVSTSTIWLLETREKNERFHPPTLTKLARALEVEPTELVSGE